MTDHLTAPLLTLPGVTHRFFTRSGGVSEGIYASLNCGPGSKDEADKVRENRSRALKELGGQSLASLYQVHGNKVITVNDLWPDDKRPEADAMVTNKKGIALGILTADCVPVLFADAEQGVIGAAHAGWKGAVAGVVAETITAMLALGAKRENIVAAIGPAIQQHSYEVGPEFVDRLIKLTPVNARYLVASGKSGYAYFDLTGYVLAALARENIKDAAMLPHDTYADEKQFFSYRRTTLRKEEDYGRQLSAIMLK